MSQLRSMFCCWLLIFMAVLQQANPAIADEQAYRDLEIQLRPLGLDYPTVGMKDVGRWSESLIMLDADSHKIVVINNGTVSRTIGGIGNAPGEFYYPAALATTREGRLYVQDSGNNRIQILDINGLFLGEISSRKGWGIAAFAKRLYVGNPTDGHLVEVYQEDGQRLAAVGELVSPAEIFGDSIGSDIERYTRALNRVHLTTDYEGNLWVAFQHLPLLRKYHRDGSILLEARIKIPGMIELEQAVRNLTYSISGLSSINIDGVQLPVILSDIEYDSSSKEIVLLLGDGRVGGFNLSGQLLYLVTFSNSAGGAIAIAPGVENRSLVVSSHFNPILVAGTYH